MQDHRRKILNNINKLLIVAMVFGLFPNVNAQVSEEIDALQEQIDARESQIEQISRQMSEYSAQVEYYANESATLQNDILLIDNQIALAELDIEMTEAEIDAQELELNILGQQISEESAKIVKQREMLEEMIFEMHKNDKLGMVEVVFGSSDFSELFDAIEQIESLNNELNQALDATKLSKANLEENKAEQETRLNELVDLESQMKVKIASYNQQNEAKSDLLVETQESETEYRKLLSELRQEQQFITSQIAKLQADIERRIAESDSAGDSSLISAPVSGGIITATFHDPTYPFRHLFEHPGLDFAVASGTPVMAAAPGIVAWTRTGRSYGNYVMVIHANGLATLYAHLSSFNVSADQFVTRGQVIGYSGNTGLSTGPHVHFEVRSNGIPVDPQAYLVDY